MVGSPPRTRVVVVERTQKGDDGTTRRTGMAQEPDEAAGDDRPSAGLGWPTTGEDA